MAVAIDDYILLERAKDALKDAVPSQSQATTDPLYLEINNLKELTENIATPSVDDASKWRKALYSLDNILPEVQQWISKTTSSSLDERLVTYNLTKRLRKVVKELKGVGRFSVNPDPPGTQISQQGGRWSTGDVDPTTRIRGIDDKVAAFERLVVDQGEGGSNVIKTIGIVGMSGVGKTTLTQSIFNSSKVVASFVPRIWVCMSKQGDDEEDNRKEAVKRILARLGVGESIIKGSEQRGGLGGLLFALHLQLMNKRYLIVLDDAWRTDKFYENLGSTGLDWPAGEQLAYGLPKGCGGTVIVTSRREEVAKKMVGVKNIHYLGPLSDPENCWLIFKDSVEEEGIAITLDRELMIRHELLKKCGGLPLAAKMMAWRYNSIEKGQTDEVAQGYSSS